MTHNEQLNRSFEIMREFDNYAKTLHPQEIRLLEDNLNNNFVRVISPTGIVDHSAMEGVYKRMLKIILKLYSVKDKTGFPMAQMVFDREIIDNDLDPETLKNNEDLIRSRLGIL